MNLALVLTVCQRVWKTSQTILLYFQREVFCLCLFYISFNGIRYCDLFVKEVFLVQIMTKYLVQIGSANKHARSS